MKDIFKNKGIDAEIIYLQGSVELAVATGIADVIVDIAYRNSRNLCPRRQGGLSIISTYECDTSKNSWS